MKTYVVLLSSTLICVHVDAQDESVDYPGVANALARISELGGSYRRDVVSVGLPPAFKDEDMAPLGYLRRHLQSLSLAKTAITDKGLEGIHAFSELRDLNLRATKITDDGVGHLAKAYSLRQLTLTRTAVTGARFDELSDLNELKRLDLSETRISFEGVKQLKTLPSLEILLLVDTAIDNSGVAELKHLVHLRELRLGSTRIQGDGGIDVAWAQALPKLHTLTLGRTHVDDRCIPALARLPNLVVLDVHQTQVTSAGINALVQLRKQGLFEALLDLSASPQQIPSETHSALVAAFEEFHVQFIQNPQ